MSKARVLALLLRFGHDTVSSQALEPGLDYWFDGDDACVAYRDVGGAWVSAGGPICALDRRDEVIARFSQAAVDADKRVRFFATEHASEQCRSIAIGQQPEWDPSLWQETLASKASLREQLRRARAKGVIVRRLTPEVIAIEGHPCREQIAAMVRDWQINRPMAPMAFLVSLDLFGNAQLKQYFVAEQAGVVQALLVAAPIPARGGWFFEDVLRAHTAPNGTIELLFDQAMRDAQSRDIKVVSYGLAPLSGEVSTWLRRVRDHSRWLYDFAGLEAFKRKLGPQRWRPVYLSMPRKERGLRATVDSLTAFANNSWLRFGLRTLLHALPTVVWALAVLLIPWSVLLIQAEVPTWFPSEEIKLAWLCFDLLLFVFLLHLALHWSPAKARLLAGLALLDGAFGIAQLAIHNRHHLHGFASWSIAVLAALVPLVVAALLGFGASRRDALYLRATAPAQVDPTRPPLDSVRGKRESS